MQALLSINSNYANNAIETESYILYKRIGRDKLVGIRPQSRVQCSNLHRDVSKSADLSRDQ